ncbi:MAG: CHASE3 domain-containing protein [Burkholderiaceae bacterium]|nr:CHASE3 domain-containing protein [Burkholderiaceae bacterium]
MEVPSLSRLRRSPFAAPLAVVVALVVVVVNESGYGAASTALGAMSNRIDARIELQQLLGRLVDAESGQRGYLLTERETYLEPYNAAAQSIEGSLRQLHAFFDDDFKGQSAMQSVDAMARQRLSELANALQLHRSGQHEQWRKLLMSNVGQETMSDLRRHMEFLVELENQRIVTDRAALRDTIQFNRIAVDIMAALALLALVLFLRKTRALDRAQVEHARALQAERDHLETEVIRRTAELTELAHHLQTAREDERSRIARELHDELGALLTAAKLDAARLKRSLGTMTPAVAERLQHLTATVDNGIAMKRRLIEDLRPSSLSNLGLLPALEIQAGEFAQRAEVRVQTHFEPVSLSEHAQITVYRLIQESLTNIAKYARASEVHLAVAPERGAVRVSVRDNGRGFDPRTVGPNAHGLLGMRYRVEAVGGKLRVTSSPGEGTRVEAWLPEAAQKTD